MGKTPGMQPRPKREHSGTSPSSANRKRPPGPWPESVVSSVPCSQTYTNILPLLCVSLAPSIARKPGFVNRRVTARDRKIPLGYRPPEFCLPSATSPQEPLPPPPAAPPPKGEASLGSPFGGRYVPVARCPAAGLRFRSGRSWTVPTGHQDPSRQARRCHAPGVTEGAHPLPPPVVIVCAGGALPQREGEKYSIYLISKGLRPFETPFL